MRKKDLFLMLLLALLPMVVWAQPKSFWGQHVNIKQASGDSIQHDLARTGDFMPVVKDGKVVWSFLAGKDGYTIDNVTSIDFPTYQEDSIEARKALIEFYHAMDGDNWVNNDNWCSDKPIWEWYGVNNSCKYNNENKDVPYVMELFLIENNLSGEIPEGCLTRMGPISDLTIWGNKIKGQYPYEINRLYSLNNIGLACNQFYGQLSFEPILSLPHLTTINFEENYFEGNLPDCDVLKAFMEGKSVTWFIIRNNLFTGKVPETIWKDPLFSSSWYFILPQRGQGLDLSDIDIPAPVFVQKYLDGTTVNSSEVYRKNKYTLIYKWGWWCTFSEAFNKRLEIAYNAYKDKGFEIIGIHAGETDKLPEYLEKHPIPWKNIDFDEWVTHPLELGNEHEHDVIDFIENWLSSPTLLLVDQKGNVVFSTLMDKDGHKPQLDTKWEALDILEKEFGPVDYNFYTSTDYSQDGEVMTIQKATEGLGIDLVFVGEGFTDKDIADGLYEQRMERAVDRMFMLEPLARLKRRFNIYAVKAVSPNSDYGNNSKHAIDEDASKALEYATKVKDLIPNRPMHVNVIYNKSSGGRSYCTMIEDGSYISYVMDDVEFYNTIIHESVGHGIGKLLDEYVEEVNQGLSLPEEKKKELDYVWTSFGWGANVDWHSNPKEVKWAKFIEDTRYADEKIGIYEGGFLYSHDSYRPTNNSMMRNNDLPFNAPSREAIYKNVMKESEGDNWTYDYETFVIEDTGGHNQYVEFMNSVAARRRIAKDTKATSLSAPPVFLKGTWRDALNRNK